MLIQHRFNLWMKYFTTFLYRAAKWDIKWLSLKAISFMSLSPLIYGHWIKTIAMCNKIGRGMQNTFAMDFHGKVKCWSSPNQFTAMEMREDAEDASPLIWRSFLMAEKKRKVILSYSILLFVCVRFLRLLCLFIHQRHDQEFPRVQGFLPSWAELLDGRERCHPWMGWAGLLGWRII